ncbi:MAG: mammalian cell entry protein [Mycobacterium sp.]
MSPRRQIQPDESPLLVEQAPKSSVWSRRLNLPQQWWKPSQSWLLPLGMSAAAVVAVTAIAISSLILVKHESHRQAERSERQVLFSVREFMTQFTSLDPFHANDYVDRLLAQATGEFAKQYQDKRNEILLHVAQAEPTRGTALEAGVERWNDDGSANVLVATEVAYKSADGKQTIENTNRWVLTAQREGDQWKISNLQQVI